MDTSTTITAKQNLCYLRLKCLYLYTFASTQTQTLGKMSKKATASGKWQDSKHTITCNLPLIIFKEGNITFFYCPALDLSGYGENEEAAEQSFNVTLDEYFKYTTHKDTLGQDLEKLGWTIKKRITKGLTPPSMSHLLETNEDFSKIFNTHDFRKTEKAVSLPCC